MFKLHISPQRHGAMRPMPAAVLAFVASSLVGTASADSVVLVSLNEETNGRFGFSVAAIPDCDGDGHDDVIIGAPGENGGGVDDAGRVYIHSGATGALIRGHSSPNDTVDGAYGFAVAGVGDLTGDGRGDYIVGAPLEAGGGRVYVYSGATGNLVRMHTSTTPVAFGRFGAAVAGLDDLTNDGRGDYIIGAPNETWVFADAGRVHIYNGSTGGVHSVRTSITPELGGEYGTSVAGVPDLDGDGRGDFVVGAPYEDPGALPIDAGRAYVYTGLNTALLHTFSSPNAQASGRFGMSVAGIPDVGGFGGGDVILTISTCDQADFNTKLAVYDGCGVACSTSTLIGCNDQGLLCGGGTSTMDIPIVAGDCLRIRIGGSGNPSGTGILTLTCTPCKSADINGNGTVDAADLAILLGAWTGAPCAGAACDADLNDDSLVNAADLAILLGEWGGNGGC
ncbi:MAG: hypothetical protein SGJ11_14855 [Phycisphaerae bacterium]|nr:hypothetical protein [Phycisphaerae bacterium]